MKQCSKCKDSKDFCFFNKNRSKKDGYSNQCKSCLKDNYDKNADNISAKHRAYYSQNKSAALARSRESYLRKKDSVLEYQKEYKLKNADSIREKARHYVSRKRKTDIEWRLRDLLRKRLKNALKYKKVETSFVRDLGCSISFLKDFIESKFSAGMDWSNHGPKSNQWQLDHIVPLFTFDLTDKDQFLKACHYTNLQPLWYKDHLIKTIKDREQYGRV